MKIFVYSDNSILTNELVGGAIELMGKNAEVTAIVSSDKASMVKGAHRVLAVEIPSDVSVDAISTTITSIVQEGEQALFLIGSTINGRSVAARISAAFCTSAIHDAKSISVEEGRVQALQIVFGGAVRQVVEGKSPVIVITVPGGVFEAVAGDSVTPEPLTWVDPPITVSKKKSLPKQRSVKDITSAKVVVCGGAGLKTSEDRALIEGLAEALEGVTGCTRPLTEGADALFKGERYIGCSGVEVRPDLYIGVGVSGQIQHIASVGEAKVLVGINADKNAPLFRYSDYGIVGDFQEIIPALIAAIR